MEIIEISHPLKDHYLTIIRDKDTNFENFREYSSKLSYLLFIEGTKNISTKSGSQEAVQQLQRSLLPTQKCNRTISKSNHSGEFSCYD